MARDSGYKLSGFMLFLLATAFAVGCGGGGGEGIAGMAQGRWGHSATLLEDGRVLVVGGQETLSVALATAEVYDPSTATWSSAGSMSEARGEGHTATLLGDGRVLVTGGSSSVEVYDPSTGGWSSTGSTLEARAWHTATLLGDGRVLVAAGMDPTAGGEQLFDSAEVYDPSTGQWSSTGSMAGEHARHTASLLGDGTVLMVGKVSAEVYDPSTGTWSPAGKPGGERQLGYTATVLGDGRVLIAGGEMYQGAWTALKVAVRAVDIYDPSTGSWSAASPMEEGRRSHPAVRLKDGGVLVIGDREAEIYDPDTDTWSSAGEMENSRTDGFTAIVLGDGTVLVVGGREDTELGLRGAKLGGQGLTAVEIYDPATGW